MNTEVLVRLDERSRYHDILTPDPIYTVQHRAYWVFTKDGEFFIPDAVLGTIDISSDVTEFYDGHAWHHVHDNSNGSMVTNIVKPHEEIKRTERCLNYKRYTENNKPREEQHIAYVRLKATSALHTILHAEISKDIPYFDRVYRVFTWDGKFFIPDPKTGNCGKCVGGKDISNHVTSFYDDLEDDQTVKYIFDRRVFIGDLGNKKDSGFVKYPENKPSPEEHECDVIPNMDSILFRGYKLFPLRVKTWDGKFFIPLLPMVECSKESGGCDISDDIALFCEDEVWHCNL